MPYYAAFVKQKLLRERTMASPGKKRVCHGAAVAVYCPCMSEQQEDMSAFNSWDCFGATLMLGVTPGIICYATTDPHDVTRAAWLCVLGVIIALVVLAVALITRWRMLGTIINGAGTCITVFYIIYVAAFWFNGCSDSAEQQSVELNLPAQQQKQPE